MIVMRDVKKELDNLRQRVLASFGESLADEKLLSYARVLLEEKLQGEIYRTISDYSPAELSELIREATGPMAHVPPRMPRMKPAKGDK